MLAKLKKFFEKSPEPTKTPAPASGFADEKTKILVATCALFLEVAYIDDEFSEEERGDILKILKKDFELSEEFALDIFQAAEKEREEALDVWQFTHRINENFSKAEKKKVLELLWQVVFTDGILDQHEEYLTRKVANLLRLEHSDFIEAKMKLKF